MKVASALFLFLTASCALTLVPPKVVAQQSQGESPRKVSSIFLGIDHLTQRDFDLLEGKRVGLLTNPAGVNRQGKSTIQILFEAPNVNLVALFGPEHGVYGNEKANVKINDHLDENTGLPVYSLYGETRKPTPAMLEDLDVMVVDLQDLGVRSYTYISCMKLAMEACFEEGVEFIVLDRPNPLGGLKVDGPMMETRWMSYVGAYRVPYVYGLTIGELARMLKEVPGWMDVPDRVRLEGSLKIVPMKGWRRSMLWPQTGLRWIATSPAIPDVSAAIGYPMTGLGSQIGDFRHGYGTPFPFRLLTYPGKSAATLSGDMRRLNIPGLSYQDRRYSKPNRQVTTGVYVVVTDYSVLRPTQLSFEMMRLSAQWSRINPFAAASEAEMILFNKHVGSTEWWDAISTRGRRVDLNYFLEKFEREAKTFQDFSRQYYIYP
ncbi:MAG: DUF1343 domain-containing protein [Verrucomicrobiota bacterium]